MKVLSLFDGISCGMVALERAGIPVERYVAYEIDENAIKVSKHNYPQIEQMGDVFKANYKEGEFDLLIGGSPCTYWSIAKSNDERETTSSGFGWELFMQYVRAYKEVKPKYFLYENNESMADAIKQEITRHLGVEPIMIDSADFSAQHRKRYYWTNIKEIERQIDKNINIIDIVENVNAEKLSHEVEFNGKQVLREKTNKPLRIGTIGKGAKTGLYLIDGDVRRLTPIEAERAQTLPDNYTEGIKDTNRYKCIGNGWTVDVIAHILSFLPKEYKNDKNEF